LEYLGGESLKQVFSVSGRFLVRLARLQLIGPGLGTVLILLAGASADTARALKNTIAENRHSALPGYHMAALGRDNATDGRMISYFLENAAGPSKAG
jgi:hypothetical protein